MHTLYWEPHRGNYRKQIITLFLIKINYKKYYTEFKIDVLKRKGSGLTIFDLFLRVQMFKEKLQILFNISFIDCLWLK